MWQRFSERARKVIFYAQEEAQRLGEGFVSTEHMLLGLVRQHDCSACKALTDARISRDRLRIELEKNLTQSNPEPNQSMTLTPRAKRVIDLAYDSARQLNNNFIGTEHLLLGLIREGTGATGQVFKKLKVKLDAVEKAVMAVQLREGVQSAAESATPTETAVGHTVRAQTVALFARQAARDVGEGNISTEQLLLGLVRDPESMAARILERLGVTPEVLRAEITRRAATYRGNTWSLNVLPRVQRVLDLAKEEAVAEGVELVGTSYYLLGVLLEEHGVGAKALAKLGVDEAKVRTAREALRAETRTEPDPEANTQ